MRPARLASSLVPLTFLACAVRDDGVPNSSTTASMATLRIDPAPAARTVPAVDDYHGTKVTDAYRWLEDLDAKEVQAWTDAQNARTEHFLSQVGRRDAVRARLLELFRYERRSTPSRHGSSWVWSQNDGLQNQDVLMIGSGPFTNGRVLLDPNTLSSEGTVALGALSFSKDGSKLAYSLSRSGSDWQEFHVLDVASGQPLADHLLHCKFTDATWTKDGKGFFYQRYPAPKAGEALEAINEKPQLCYHEVGKPQSEDRVVYERPDEPKWGFATTLSEDGRYLVISIWSGTDRRNRVAYLDLAEAGAAVKPLLMDFDASYDFVEAIGTRWIFRTDLEAPRGRLIAIDVTTPERARWETLVAEQKDALQSVRSLGGRLFLSYLHDAHSLVRVHGFDGKLLDEPRFPTLGSVGVAGGNHDDEAAWFSFTSFTFPTAVLRYDIASKALTTSWSPKVAFDAAAFTTKQVFYQSKDGTRVPLFLVHKKGLTLDGSHPTYLYGYGGFNVPETPAFATGIVAWLETGGIYALACLRGGSEYGEEWHRAGMLERKQNVFDDFCAAAEYLIRNAYTRPSRLAIGGGSNGGLLVGAALTQRPELFGAAIPEVGVLDMLRYHKFTIGWAWIPEYGSAEDPAMFPVLHRYSPLHNLRPGVAYPPTLVMTGDHDDRVMPAHSFKFTAAMQAAAGPQAPVFLRVEKEAGHGAGTPVKKRIAGAADRWAFLLATIGANE